jgi:putative ABC transport system permease protein
MFNLEHALAAWRRTFEHHRAFSADDLDELEQHLRDEVARLVEEGMDVEAAYRRALTEMGDFGTAEMEYRKVYWGKLQRQHRLGEELTWRIAMFRNYVTIAYRNLARHAGYAFINIFGLAIGMAVCLLLFLFVDHELQFDAFHAEQDRIYRLNEVQSFEGMNAQHVALSMYPMAPAMQEEFPEVASFVRFVDASDLLVYEDRQTLLDNAFWVDSTFFEVFGFDLIRGDEATALTQPGSAVLTASTARKVFGDEDPIGKTIRSGETPLQVTGVLADVPATSHLQFDAVYAVHTIEEPDWLENWGSNWLVTYLLLQEGAAAEKLEAKFRDYQIAYMGEESLPYYTLYLQPLRDVHLGSAHITHDYHNFRKFDRKYVYTFSLLAVFVLLIAAINFMNISTARAAQRAKEVGVRKTVGAQRYELAQQFIGESVMLALLALLLALFLAAVSIPLVEVLTDRDLSPGFFLAPQVGLLIVGTTLLMGVLSGLYPALFISSFKPVRVLKQQAFSTHSGRRFSLRNGLVVLQFTIAIAMIVGTVLTLQQLRYLQSRDPGFDRDQIVVLPLNRTANEKYDVLRAELLQHPHIQGVTASGQRLGNNIHQNGVRAEGADGMREFVSSHLNVDYDFLSLYDLRLKAGRTFSRARGTDQSHAFVVNEAMVREMGWDDPVGKGFALGWQDSTGTVIGVVADFNFNSLHHKIQPIAMSVQDWGYSELSVRIDAARMEETLAFLEATWDEAVGDWPFVYTFLDEHFAQLYQTDRKVSRVVGLLAILAIFVACLGLFGLSSIVIDQRIKEIGIRKVLGATVPQLVLLVSKSFAGLVGLAFVIAAPLSYLLIQRWLQGYAYHIDIQPAVFVAAGAASLCIALLTVSFRALRAARVNPVQSLRYE